MLREELMRRIAVILIVIAAAAQFGGCTGTLHLGTQISAFAPR